LFPRFFGITKTFRPFFSAPDDEPAVLELPLELGEPELLLGFEDEPHAVTATAAMRTTAGTPRTRMRDRPDRPTL
jgi:hypothetical protein